MPNTSLSPKAFEVDQIARGDNDVFGKRAVQMHSLHANVLADVPLAGRALLAVPAEDMHLGGHVIADAGNTGMNVFADFHDFTAELVADDDGLVT